VGLAPLARASVSGVGRDGSQRSIRRRIGRVDGGRSPEVVDVERPAVAVSSEAAVNERAELRLMPGVQEVAVQ
jgi:hypothetical protein